jgi:hypothetical protein
MPILVERFNHPGQHAIFDPQTGSIRVLPRDEHVGTNSAGGARIRGWFDVLASPALITAFYRDEAEEWQLLIADDRIPVADDLRSEYEPSDPGRLPLKLRGTGRRVFRLVRGSQVVYEHRYRGDSIWERLIDALQGTLPTMPAYDLLFEVHRVLNDRERRRRLFR